MAATGFGTLHLSVPRVYGIAWPAYGAGVLALDRHVGISGERRPAAAGGVHDGGRDAHRHAR